MNERKNKMKTNHVAWNFDPDIVRNTAIHISAAVFFCPDLTPNARLLYGLLATSEVCRNARNIELARLLQFKHSQPVSNAISKLRRFGFIKVEYSRKGEYIEREQNNVNFDSQWSRKRRILIVEQGGSQP